MYAGINIKPFVGWFPWHDKAKDMSFKTLTSLFEHRSIDLINNIILVTGQYKNRHYFMQFCLMTLEISLALNGKFAVTINKCNT